MSLHELRPDFIREIIEDLESTLVISNIWWNEWEREFIEDMVKKLSLKDIRLTPKQIQKLEDLRDRI